MRTLILIIATLLLGTTGAGAQKFYADDPLWEDRDCLDTPERPAEIELSDYYDRFGHIFHDFGASSIGSEAENVNTLDEVPNSSWFTNRHGRDRMSIEELTRGPDQGAVPDPSQTWMVFKGKSSGLTPGFQIEDEQGVRYVIKLDPVGVPELSTAAEAIATKLFYAMGYHVPENYIVHVDPAHFEIKSGTTVTDRFGDKIPLTLKRLQRLIRRVPRLPDGKIRVTASKYLDGHPIGPFRYYETRSDDPNDVIRHEQRRELRGLRLFSAWTNHDDTRAINTFDSYVQVGDVHCVRHYLIDFGSAFGSGSVDLQLPNLSFHYWLDLDMVKKNAIAFGLHVPKYRKVKWPNFPEYESVGRWEGDYFEAEEWKNDYPNPAFVRMTARDAFWAAKIIMRFTPEELRAIVEIGQYTDPVQEQYFYDVLLERQRKCGVFGINGVNPLDEFRIENDTLTFANLSERHGFCAGETTYRVAWSVYDNSDDSVHPITTPTEFGEPRIPLPDAGERPHDGDRHLLAEIKSLHPDFPHWEGRLGVYLRPQGNGYEIAGIERE